LHDACGKEFDDLRYARDMQRATVSDVANTCAQAGASIRAGLPEAT
jgi:alpha-ketoglutarate-dependent 2,4-dichlorophenoxyacetate dioxygenase